MKWIRKVNEEGLLEITTTLEYPQCELEVEECEDLMECEGKFFCNVFDGEHSVCPYRKEVDK